MSSGFTAGVLTMFVPIFLFSASCANSKDNEKEKESQKRYPSPTAVFDAYREVREKREWGKWFSLLTPEAQNGAVFEDFFSCTMSDSSGSDTEATMIVKKYVDLGKIQDDYDQRYKKKHGIDIAKLMAEHKNDQTFVPPTHDEQLWRDVVAAHIKDKAGFNEAVAKHFDEKAAKQHEANPVMPLGDLEHLVVHDDTATGSAKETILPSGGESPRKPGEEPPVYDKPFKFRRINGGWLIDSPGGLCQY